MMDSLDGKVHTAERLAELQALPLWRKVMITQTRIIEWYTKNKGKVVVSFSGGKDSTVLLHIARQIFPDIMACYSDTGLEYPEVKKFVSTFDNVDIVRPSMRFDQVLTQYGYPLIGKEVGGAIYYARLIRQGRTGSYKRRQMLGQVDQDSIYNKERWIPLARDIPVKISAYCCYKMKKSPMGKYQRANGLLPILGTLAEESLLRKQQWINRGCNAFDAKHPSSTPMAFWLEQDVLQYISDEHIPIAAPYGSIVGVDDDGNEYDPHSTLMQCKLKCTGCDRTGCIFCAFGFHLEKGETRFQRLAKTHPRQYEYSIKGGQWADNPSYDPSLPEYDGEWKNWNPKKIWMPSREGLGMGKVFDMVNELYGKDFYRYE